MLPFGKSNADAGPDIGHEGSAGHEVVIAVGHEGELLNLAANRRAGGAGGGRAGGGRRAAPPRVARGDRGSARGGSAGSAGTSAVIGSEHALDLETRANEVVAHNAARCPAGIHVIAAVDEPVYAAFDTDVEPLERFPLLRRLRPQLKR